MKTRLTEKDLSRIVKRVINEAEAGSYPPECQNIKQFMDAMSKTNKLSFKIETGVSYGPLGGELLILTDPNGRACRVTKKEFFQLGI